MKFSRILPAIAIATVAAGATNSAFADTGEDRGEIATAMSAKVSAAQAITAAEQRAGGHAAKLDIEKDNGAYHYEVKTISKRKLTEMIVNPASGQVTGTDSEGFFGRLFEDEDTDDFKGLDFSPTSLAAAVSKAESETGGKTIEARFDGDHGKKLFKIEVAKGNTLHRVVIDADHGSVVNIASDNDEEHGED